MIDYDRYKELTGDKDVTSEFFNRLKKYIEGRINYYTFGRLDYKRDKERIEECFIVCFEAIKSDMVMHDDKDENIKSEVVGDLRIEYYVPQITELNQIYNAKESKIYRIIKLYFAHTGLMYKGF